MTKEKFKKNERGWVVLPNNEILDFDSYYISYNVMPCSDIPFFASDNGCAETALCTEGDEIEFRKFYVLNGDFRTEYEELGPKGFVACKEFFDSKRKEFGSSWSD